jgi:thiol-disulfide isomerase/thioredoxin
MRVSDVLLLLIRGILLLITSIFITNFNWTIQFILIGFLFFFFSALVIERIRNLNLLIPALLIYLPFFLVYGVSSINGGSYQTFPIWGIALLSSLLGYWIKFKPYKKIFLLAYPALIAAAGFLGMPNYLNFIMEPYSVSKERLPSVSFLSEYGTKVSLQDMKGKIIVLDFWASNCLPCFRKFPELERLYTEYKNSGDVAVYSINLPQPNEEIGHTKKLIGRYNYDFPKLYAPDETAWKQFNIEAVPALLIIDRNLNIRFRGGLNAKWYHFYGNAKKIIESLRNE